jgi:hypothetical protein
MKKIVFILISLLYHFCNAQSPVINLTERGDFISNAYYKDINNMLDAYEGTYIYENGSTFFKIVLIKKNMKSFTTDEGQYFEDLIVGEYQYIENGIEKANTLSDLNIDFSRQRKHKINGNKLINRNNRAWVCYDCSSLEKRLALRINDVISGRYGDFIIHRKIENNQEVIKVLATHFSGAIMIGDEPEPMGFALPQGEFTMIKQP